MIAGVSSRGLLNVGGTGGFADGIEVETTSGTELGGR